MADKRTKPRAPADLGKRGKGFWKKTLKTFDLSDGELELLVEVCRMLDACETLETTVQADGPTASGSKGQVVCHPALTELRQQRLALGRLLAQLELPDEEQETTVHSPASSRARRAARARWGT